MAASIHARWLYAFALVGVCACSSERSAPAGQDSAATSGGAAGSSVSGAGAAAAGGGSGTGVAGRAGAAGSTAAASRASGAGGATAGIGGSSAAAGSPASSAGGAAPDPTSAGPTECNGMRFPPRAMAKAGPFEVGPAKAGLPVYWPTEAWKTETPDKLGFDPMKLEAALAFETQHSNTEAIFVVRHGYVAAEKYSGSFSATSRHESYSMAKSFTSGLIGIAIAEGKLASTDEKVCKFYPDDWDCADMMDPRSRITVDHAMNLTTGLRWTEDWRSMATTPNDALNAGMVNTALARECVAEPGSMKRYSTGDPSLLAGVLEESTGMTALAYAKQKLFDVIGIPDVRWGQDSNGRTTVYAGMQATAAEFAKYGYLMLNHGRWDGKQVIPGEWIDRTTRATKPCEDWNQWLWHVNLPLRFGKQPTNCSSTGMPFCTPTDIANVPADGFTAKGVNGQFIMVLPSVDLVVVRLASDNPGSEFWDEYARGLLEGILDAMR